MKLTIRDFGVLIKILIVIIPAKIYHIFNRDIWIVSEYRNQARDNGYWFFKYLQDHHLHKQVYYPINHKCQDAQKLKNYAHVIEFGSWKHIFLFFCATKLITSTQFQGLPYFKFFGYLINNGIQGGKYIFLNHGIAREYSSVLDPKLIKYDLIIAASQREAEVIIKENNQPAEKVKPVGFCRYDSLDDSLLEPKTILILPTWRKWLYQHHGSEEFDIEILEQHFLESNYYHQYMKLINDENLIKFAEANNLKIRFCLHAYAKLFTSDFKTHSQVIEVVNIGDVFVQDELKKAAILITDYSTVCFDFALMNKPVIYFQFDREHFFEKQYSEGQYFTYANNGFGPVCLNEKAVVNYLMEAYKRQFKMEDTYVKRVNDYFDEQHHNHCEKVYHLVDEL